jgi:hypothetical protein
MENWLQVHYDCDGIDFIDHGGWGERHECLQELCRLAHSQVKSDLDLSQQKVAIYSADHQIHVRPFGTDYAYYSISDTLEKAHNCFPCFNFMSWRDAAIPDFTETIKEIHEKSQAPPKHDKLFWIGNMGTHTNRITFWKLARKHPDTIVCTTMRWLGDGKATSYVSLPDHTEYSQLIDIEGSGYSGRLKFLAHMGRTLLVQDRPLWDWAGSLLRPGEHFVPVNRQFKDLFDVLEDLKHEDPTDMIKRCSDFASAYITRERAVDHAAALLLSATH